MCNVHGIRGRDSGEGEGEGKGEELPWTKRVVIKILELGGIKIKF